MISIALSINDDEGYLKYSRSRNGRHCGGLPCQMKHTHSQRLTRSISSGPLFYCSFFVGVGGAPGSIFGEEHDGKVARFVRGPSILQMLSVKRCL